MSVVTIYEDGDTRVRADPKDWRGTMVYERRVQQGVQRWEQVSGVQRIAFVQEVRKLPVVSVTRVGQSGGTS